jgi:hypothetical protein
MNKYFFNQITVKNCTCYIKYDSLLLKDCWDDCLKAALCFGKAFHSKGPFFWNHMHTLPSPSRNGLRPNLLHHNLLPGKCYVIEETSQWPFLGLHLLHILVLLLDGATNFGLHADCFQVAYYTMSNGRIILNDDVEELGSRLLQNGIKTSGWKKCGMTWLGVSGPCAKIMNRDLQNM